MVGPVKGRGTSLDPANRFEGIRLDVLPEAEAEMVFNGFDKSPKKLVSGSILVKPV